jgi:PAS domain S-box-containing protein
VPAITYIVDLQPSPHTTFISPQVKSLLGFEAAEWLEDDHVWKDHIHPEDRDRVVEEVKRSNETGQPFLLEYRFTARDGHTVWLRNVATVKKDDQGRARYTHGIITDVTARRQAEEALQRAEDKLRQSQKMEALGRLAGGVAHDFNNLLTSIMGFARLIHDELPDGHALRSDVEEILRAGERAANLTRQLLAFGRKQVLHVGEVDVNNVVRDMDRLLRRTLGEDIEVVTTLGEDLGALLADPGQISQILLNLAVNARDAMPRGGKLIIATSRVTLTPAACRSRPGLKPGDYIVLSVRDTGCGMDDFVREHAFEPFFSTKRADDRSGLGLSMVYGIVQQCSGHIELDSAPNEGAEFRIYFPWHEPQKVAIASPDNRPLPRGKEWVLVVEDEETVRHLTVRILQSLGYQVVQARNGSEALAIAEKKEQPIELVLSDVVMPQMGGPAFVERLLKIRRDFKVLYMTGFTQDHLFQDGVATAKINVILKPFTRESLARKIREVMDN